MFCSGSGTRLAPEAVEVVAVEPPRRGLEPRRVDEVRRADLGDPHRQLWVALHDRAGGARVVEVDVREQQMANVGQLELELAQALLEARQGRRGAAVEERRAVVGLDEVDADRALQAEEMQVERIQHRRPA